MNKALLILFVSGLGFAATTYHIDPEDVVPIKDHCNVTWGNLLHLTASNLDLAERVSNGKSLDQSLIQEIDDFGHALEERLEKDDTFDGTVVVDKLMSYFQLIAMRKMELTSEIKKLTVEMDHLMSFTHRNFKEETQLNSTTLSIAKIIKLLGSYDETSTLLNNVLSKIPGQATSKISPEPSLN